MRRILGFCLLLALGLGTASSALAETSIGAPVIRLRVGMSLLNFTAGGQYVKSTPLSELLTFNPQVLWNLPSFRARMGFHYLGDFSSAFGFVPISGIGVSAYFYPFGLSSAYEIEPDLTLIQKSKPGPYVFIGITPVNMNINTPNGNFGGAVSYSAFIIETMIGAGYDYPLSPNAFIAVDAQYRFGSADDTKNNQKISYGGPGIMAVFSTSYH